MGRLFDTTETNKSSSSTSGKTTTGRLFKEPVEKKPSTLGKFVKAVVSPVATTVARPIQAIAALGGAELEDIDKFTEDKFGGYVAPTPKNTSDVIKDVGRAAQTVAFGTLPGVGQVGNVVAGGVLGGTGIALEQGGADTTIKDVGLNSALGVGTGLVLNKVIGGLTKGKTKLPAKTVQEVGEEVEKTGIVSKAPKSTKTIEEVLTPDSVPAQAIPEQPIIKTQVVNPKQTIDVLDDVVRNTENVVDDEFVRQKSTEYFTKLQKYSPEEILSTLRKGESLEGMPKEALSSFLAKHADDTGDLALTKKVRRQMFAEKGGQEAQARTLSKGTTADITRDIIKGRAKTQGINLQKTESEVKKLTKDLTKKVKQVIESSKTGVKVTREQVREIIKDLMC